MPVVCHFLLKKSFITGITILQPLYLLYIYAILIPNWGDMLTTRFGKLQDIIGSKIFPLILNLLEEDAVAFIDKLNKLEKLGYIEDANWWIELREIRNKIAHYYPDDHDLICSHISVATIKAAGLIEFWQKLKTKIVRL